jgi:predicted Zn-dependent protease
MLSPELSVQLVHECVGHTCEADNFSAFRSSTGVDIGDRLFNININVADDPNFGLRGGYSFDSEGVGASNVKLVKDGVLAGLLHSEETALKFRADSTGHGRTVSRGSRAMPRMSCTIVQSSQTHPNASFSVEDVAYRLRGFRGSYSFGQYCFIECDFAEQLDRGDPTGIVYRAVALLGRKLDFLNKITGLSQTSRVIEPAHGCDKEGQCGLPVSMVSPSMRIESVAVMPAQRAKRMLGTI